MLQTFEFTHPTKNKLKPPSILPNDFNKIDYKKIHY